MQDGWATIVLGDVFVPTGDRLGSQAAEPRVFSISKHDGVVPADEYHGRRIASEKLDTYKRLPDEGWAYSTIHIDEGSIARNTNGFDGVVSPMYTTMKWDSETNDPAFFEMLLRSSDMLTRYGDSAQGSINRRRSLPWSTFSTMRVDVPPLHEQRRIVDLIGSLDEAIEAADEVVSAAVWARDALAESMIQSAGGPSTSLKEVIRIARGGSPRPIDSFITDAQDGLNWIKIGDVSPDGRYITSTKVKIKPSGLSKTRAVKAGDFVLSNSMSFGRPYILAIDGCIHDGWLSLSEFSDSFHAEYLYYLLRGREVQAQFQSVAAGSSVRNLNKGSVGEVAVRIPALEEQARIVELLRSVDEVQEAEAFYATSLRNLRTNLLTALLSGAHEVPNPYDDLLAEAM